MPTFVLEPGVICRSAIIVALCACAALTSPAMAAVVPSQGMVYPAGTEFKGECDPSEQIPATGTQNERWETAFTYSNVQRYRAKVTQGASPWYPPPGPPPASWGTGTIDAPKDWTYADTCIETFVINRPGHYLMQRYRTIHHFIYFDPNLPGEFNGLATPCPAGYTRNGSPGRPFHDHTKQVVANWGNGGQCQDHAAANGVFFTVVSAPASCGAMDYSAPATQDYLNQYSAGEALGLPTTSGASGMRGGNACGPSSMAMGLNRLKKAAGEQTSFADLAALYRSTQSAPPQDGIQNPFMWTKGAATARSLGWEVTQYLPGDPKTVTDTISFMSAFVSSGSAVLVSTTFGGARWGVRGGGHVVLFTGTFSGRTADNTPFLDYLAYDPAGDYGASVSGHYGKGKCGREVRYPQDWVVANVADGDRQRPALAIHATPGADPRELVVIDRSGGTGTGFDFWVEGPAGQRAGWLGPAQLEEWSEVGVHREPPVPSDPDEPEQAEPPYEEWPRVFTVSRADPGLKVRVRATTSGEAALEIFVVENGNVLLQRIERLTLAPGQEVTLATSGAGGTDGGAAIGGPGGKACGCSAGGGLGTLALVFFALRRHAAAGRHGRGADPKEKQRCA